jgi:glycosyltransferase involved in cell wall biosynthesis
MLIAIVGALEERKGHATLFEALARLSVSVQAVIVGKGRMEREYREKAAALGLSDRVHFTGYRDDVPSIMRNIDILVVPSSVEATPYVILEAMEAGLPVVASSVFGIPEQVVDGETGLLVPAKDADGLANALRILQADPERRRLMGKNALRRYRARFTLERCVRGTIEVYRELMRG